MDYLELKNKKYFISPLLKLKNMGIYGIIFINEKKEELAKVSSDTNRKIICFSDILNMNNSNEYYNIIKNIKGTLFNRNLMDLKIPLYISRIKDSNNIERNPAVNLDNTMESDNTELDNTELDNTELCIYLYKLVDNISNYLPRFKINKIKM